MVRVSRWVIRITLLRAEDALGDSLWCVVYGVIMIPIHFCVQDEALTDSLWCVVYGVIMITVLCSG